MSAVDQLIEANTRRGASDAGSGLSARPLRKVAIVTCMDARLDPAQIFGLEDGDAHVIRNAGGIATDDVVRSLVLSQRLLGTEEIALVQHLGCAMASVRDEALKDAIEAETGVRPSFAFEGGHEPEDALKASAARLRAVPFLDTSALRSFLYDLDSGLVREVAAD